MLNRIEIHLEVTNEKVLLKERPGLESLMYIYRFYESVNLGRI